MSSPETLIFDAVNAYIAAIRAALPAISVLDGPYAEIPTDQDFVVVGSDDLLATGMSNAVTDGLQEWIDNGQTRRETFTIASTYVVWTGDTSIGAFTDCRSRAKTSLVTIASALRPTGNAGTGDGMLNGTLNLGTAGWCGLYVGRLQQVSEANVELEDGSVSQGGTAIHVAFYLACVAYL